MEPIDWKDIELGTLAEGQLEIDFQALLPKLRQAFEGDLRRYEITTNGKIVFKMTAEIYFEKDVKTNAVVVYARITPKEPKTRVFGGEVRIRNGHVQVEKARQQELPSGDFLDTNTGEITSN